MRASFEIKHQLCGCREEVLREEEGGESKITVSDEEKRDQFFLQSALQIGSEKKILLNHVGTGQYHENKEGMGILELRWSSSKLPIISTIFLGANCLTFLCGEKNEKKNKSCFKKP